MQNNQFTKLFNEIRCDHINNRNGIFFDEQENTHVFYVFFFYLKKTSFMHFLQPNCYILIIEKNRKNLEYSYRKQTKIGRHNMLVQFSINFLLPNQNHFGFFFSLKYLMKMNIV